MGLFSFLARDTVCPTCGDRQARKGLFGGVKCPNRDCNNFDPGLRHDREEARHVAEMEAAVSAGTARRYHNPRAGRPVYRALPGEGFDPGRFRIAVEYENFRGEEKTFQGDWRTLRRAGRHVSLRVVPTGTRIALDTRRIGNLVDVEGALERCPTNKERRVLDYHARRGTTSQRCEDLRRKYPDWAAGN